MGMAKEFKEFVMRGNVVDMAVGIIIGAAFQKIVTSLVNDVMMPPIGDLLSNVNFKDMFFNLNMAHRDMGLDEAQKIKDPIIMYGSFLNEVIGFLITAICVFIVIKIMNTMKRKKEDAPPPAPPKQEVLLEEIRDLLKTGRAG